MARVKKAQGGGTCGPSGCGGNPLYKFRGNKAGRSSGVTRKERKEVEESNKYYDSPYRMLPDDKRFKGINYRKSRQTSEQTSRALASAQTGKKVRLKEDSRDYITKIKTDDKGDITSLKSRRTLKGLLTGAPRAKKIMKNGGKTPAWQRTEGKNPSGGLNAKGVASYRAANPGSKLKTAVTTKPSKLKPGSKAASRRKSFCSRMSGMKKKLTSAKTANDPNSRINKSLRKWNC